MSIEMVNFFSDDLALTGSAPRSEAHRLGLLHDVVHCWIVDPRGEGRVFFQRRAASKETFPGYYDIAVGGHIAAGEAPLDAAIRETREETGLLLTPERLIFAGSVRKADYFYEHLDREIGRVFLLLEPEPEFRPGDEVDEMVWVAVPEYLRRFDKPEIQAHGDGGRELSIPLTLWAGSPSREFEDWILPLIWKNHV